MRMPLAVLAALGTRALVAALGTRALVAALGTRALVAALLVPGRESVYRARVWAVTFAAAFLVLVAVDLLSVRAVT